MSFVYFEDEMLRRKKCSWLYKKYKKMQKQLFGEKKIRETRRLHNKITENVYSYISAYSDCLTIATYVSYFAPK